MTRFLASIPLLVLLSFPSLCSARVGSLDLNDLDRQLFLVNTSASEGANVSSKFAALGYESEHNSTCVYRVYGTPAHVAAGDRDLFWIATTFKKMFNKFAKLESDNVFMTQNEVISQRIGDTVDNRRLSQENRGLLMVPYSFGFMISKFTCKLCSGDSADARRSLQETLRTEDFVEQLQDNLKKSKSKYFKQALRDTSCLRIQCDDGSVFESKACINYPLE